MDPWPPAAELLDRLVPPAIEWDLPAFLRAYTLHDSGLIAVRLDPPVGLLLRVEWDLVWNRQVPPAFRHLVIGFPTVYSVSWSQGGWHQSTLSGATSEPVSAADRERMLADGSVDLRAYQGDRDQVRPPFDDPTLTRSTFQGMNWSALRVLHGRPVRFACLDDDGRPGPLRRP